MGAYVFFHNWKNMGVFMKVFLYCVYYTLTNVMACFCINIQNLIYYYLCLNYSNYYYYYYYYLTLSGLIPEYKGWSYPL